MIDRVSGAPPWHLPAAAPAPGPAFEPAFDDEAPAPEPMPDPPPLGAPGPPTGAADVVARYRSAAEAAEAALLARTEFWA